jgi:hypothetical protein
MSHSEHDEKMRRINILKEDTVTIAVSSSTTIEHAPELAILSLLKGTLALAIRELACAHPEIGTTEDSQGQKNSPPLFPSASACTANAIIAHLDALNYCIDAYHRSRVSELTRPETAPDESVPF